MINNKTSTPSVRHYLLHPMLFMLFMLISLQACDQQSTAPSDGTGTMKVMLHDNPGDFQEVWIDIESVQVNPNQLEEANQDEESTWTVINEPQQRYNLLELVNGAREVLGETELEAGYYRQIRLILGDDNTVVVNDSTYQLQTPSAQQSGLKIKIDTEIEEGMNYELNLDFDVARSIVQKGGGASNNPAPDRGNGNGYSEDRMHGNGAYSYLLKPVIRAYTNAQAGSVSGVVAPAEVEPWIYAIAGEDTTASTRPEENTGSFRLMGLPEDTYTISVEPVSEAYESVEVQDVTVTAGENHDLGTIPIE